MTAESGVHCWGRLPAAGDAGSARSLRPVRIVELDGAVEVALGDTLACARLAGGTVTCAGAAAPDAGTGGFEPVPGVERADALFAGGRHACALSPGSARCWGDGAEGQLGTGERASWAAASAVSFR